MTIGLGFVGNDGVVLCADTQQTISGYIKTYDGKVDLHIFHDRKIVLSFVGAGTQDYINTAKQTVVEDFPEAVEHCKGMSDVRALLRDRLLKFFDDHLARWAYFPRGERPTVELLIGVTGKGLYPTLFHYDGTAFHQTGQKAIGDGVLLADQLMKEYSFGEYRVAQLASLGVYILNKVKKGVDGCGGSTHVVALRKGWDFALTDHQQIKEMEQRFDEFDKTTDKAVAKSIFENPLPLSWHTEYKDQKPAKKSTKALGEGQIGQ